MPIENIRWSLLIALAVVLFLLGRAWQQDYAHPPKSSPESAVGDPAPAPGSRPALPGAPTTSPGAGSSALPGADQRGPSVRVRTDVLSIEIDLRGGDVRRAELLRYPVRVEQPNEPVHVFDDDPPDVFVAQSGLIGVPAAPDHRALYSSERTDYRLRPGRQELKVFLRWQGEEGVSVVKTYTFRRGSYLIEVTHRVQNGGDAPWNGRMYAQFQRTKPTRKRGPSPIYGYTGGVISTQDDSYEKVDFDDIADRDLRRDSPGGWVAMIQRYFAGVWVPDPEASNYFYSKALPDGRYLLGVASPAHIIAPGQSARLKMALYAGPELQSQLPALAPHLERIVDYGWPWFISQPLFWLLDKIHSLIGNWGWSIVLLTAVVKLAFLRLSAASYKSMAHMRLLQPRVQAIRERCGDDKLETNRAIMALYKEEKVNPLGGCLPILVQVPVFIALYRVLIDSVELRQAPFIFWIQDLSTKDPYFVLPLLMGAAMLLQQRLNPAPPDPLQAKIMRALPLVFTFLFLSFPAGLVLYWLVSNLLSIAQQWFITRYVVRGLS